MLTDRPWKTDAVVRLILLGLGSIGLGAIVVTSAHNWLEAQSPPDQEFYRQISSLLLLQGLGLVWVYLFVREHGVGPAEAFGLGRAPARSAALGAVAMLGALPVIFGVMMLVNFLIRHFTGDGPAEQMTVGFLRGGPPWWQSAAMGLAAVVLAPLAEESVFRGVLYPFLKQKGYPRLAWLGTALAFGCIHFNVAALLPLTCLALLWTWLYERTGNLIAPVAGHMIFNAVNFSLLVAEKPAWLERLLQP